MIHKGVLLTDAEYQLCVEMAKTIQDQYSDMGVETRKVDSHRNDLTINIQGLAAEYAFCKLFKTKFDSSTSPRSHQNNTDTGDTVLNGLVVDVKQSKYVTARLMVPKHQNVPDNPIDIYALMVGSNKGYVFKGFLAKDDIFKEERYDSKFNAYIAKQDELKEFYELNFV